jgi:NAD(P)-dependent dehydrogenase (short-subunit alcohol dehydrogenase family)
MVRIARELHREVATGEQARSIYRIGKFYRNADARGMREALRLMEPQRNGRTFNIASVAGISTASTHSPDYSAAKAAVVSFIRRPARSMSPAPTSWRTRSPVAAC